MSDDENECKQADEWDCSIDDYVSFKHKRYNGTLYTYIGKIIKIWFPTCINNAHRYITIDLLYTDDDWMDHEEICINISQIDKTKCDEFKIISEVNAVTKVL